MARKSAKDIINKVKAKKRPEKTNFTFRLDADLMAAFYKKCEKAGVSKKDADAIVSATIDSIMEAVSNGEKVTLIGFGSFEARARKEREGRNPKTGATMTIPATTVPAFSAGKAFKEAVSA